MIVTTTDIQGLQKHATGKVRDIYDLGDSLLMVATDRISAFDVVLPTGIPDKGKVLTQMSLFWFGLVDDVIENHLVTADTTRSSSFIGRAGAVDPEQYREILDGRSMITVKAEPTPIECIVRGYLAGSAWKEYKALCAASEMAGRVVLHGVKLPGDMVESQKMPEPVFHAIHQGLRGPRHQYQRRACAGDRRRGPGQAARSGVARCLQARVGLRRRAWDHHLRHQVRVRHVRGQAHTDRRGPHSRFVPILGRRCL